MKLMAAVLGTIAFFGCTQCATQEAQAPSKAAVHSAGSDDDLYSEGFDEDCTLPPEDISGVPRSVCIRQKATDEVCCGYAFRTMQDESVMLCTQILCLKHCEGRWHAEALRCNKEQQEAL